MLKKALIGLSLVGLPAWGEGVEFELLVPATSEPLVQEVFVPVRSPDGINIDELSYILRSQETGYYPSYGWTGEYYITGVTHGQVNSSENYQLAKINTPRTNIPEPSTMTLLGTGLLLLTRRRR